jgi:ATP-dependent Lon protease
VIWVATANDERAIPEPILNRMNVFEVQAPDRDAARTIAGGCTAHPRPSTTGAAASTPSPAEAVLDRMAGWPRARCGAPG